MKIENKWWFTPGQGPCIGVVSVVNDVGERRLYIGTGDGLSEEADARKIAAWGTRVHKDMLEAMLEKLNEQ